jgi:topoisomerase-4 subunit A
MDTAAFDIIDRDLGEVIGEKYLSYALSTIMSRSLPDVRDGLKPVHRRLMHGMRQLNLKPETSPKKSARIVGDVMGKYHPHGDMAIYNAMVRLAQDFAVRYPLVDGQGNFGNIDGDNAAAMRYTEARLTTVAELLLEQIDEDTVDFRETYDGESKEPVVLPANFPNLLANGASGIAVGMACSIPPHNVSELCDALTHLIENPQAEVKDLVEFVQGPDFPTGGKLVEEPENILEAYETGRGGFRVRAKWEKEDLKHGQYQIVITEIPYQVQKSRLIEKIAELIAGKKIPLLDDINDESTEEIRIVLTPKNKNVDPELLMGWLFKNTELESRISLNMNVLDGGITPRVMNLKEVLEAFLDHRRVVLVRRTEYRLGKIADRLEVLLGYLVAYLNLDEVIKIIREEDEPKKVLCARFDLTEAQADAILNMRLRSLRKLEEIEIRKEHKELLNEKEELEKLLGSRQRQNTQIKRQIARIQDLFSIDSPLGARRTEIGIAEIDTDVPMEVMIEREPITVVCSEKGWVRAMKGHIENDKIKELKYKDGDREKFAFYAETTDKVIVFGTNGVFYTILANDLPAGRGFGDPIRLMMGMPNDADVVTLFKHEPENKLLVATDSGHGFIVSQKDIEAQTKNGKKVLNVKGDVEAKVCTAVPDDADSIAVIGDNRKMLIFPLEELPEMSRGKGVILQRFKDGGLSDAQAFKLEDGISWTTGAGTRTETKLDPWIGKRAQAGKLPPNGFPRANSFSTVILDK